MTTREPIEPVGPSAFTPRRSALECAFGPFRGPLVSLRFPLRAPLRRSRNTTGLNSPTPYPHPPPPHSILPLSYLTHLGPWVLALDAERRTFFARYVRQDKRTGDSTLPTKSVDSRLNFESIYSVLMYTRELKKK